MTCWASEEKQRCVQAQKTQNVGVHEPFQSFVECLPGLTHLTAMLQWKYRQLRLCFHYTSALATIRSSGVPLPPTPTSQTVNFSSMKWCIISSVVLYNWLQGHAVNRSSKRGAGWATGINEYCHISEYCHWYHESMVSTWALLYCNHLHALNLIVGWVLKNRVDYAALCLARWTGLRHCPLLGWNVQLMH